MPGTLVTGTILRGKRENAGIEYQQYADDTGNPVLMPASELDTAHAMSLGRTSSEASTPDVAPEAPAETSTDKKEVIKYQPSYNERMLESFKDRINTVLAKLIVSTDPDQKNIGKLLQSALTDKLSRASVRALQTTMIAAGVTAIGSKDGKPD